MKFQQEQVLVLLEELLFGIKENNYLGKGLGLDANVTVNSESFKGKIGIENPNFNNSDKSLFEIYKQ